MQNTITIVEGVEASIENNTVKFIGEKGELEREFSYPHIKIQINGNSIVLTSDLEKKQIKAVMGTWKALMNNMILGVKYEWRAELAAKYSHFPMKLKVDENTLMIENFLGERSPRKVPLPANLTVDVKGSDIVVTGISKEGVGQLAGRIEQTTKIKGYDKRVFQDGCYIVKKPYSLGDNDG